MSQIRIDDTQVETLRTLHNAHRLEITHHREMQFRVFSWATSLLLAVTASIFAFGSQWASSRYIGAPVLTITIAAVLLTTLLLLRRSAQALESNARAVVKIDKMLGLFEPGQYVAEDTVYAQSWLNWGTPKQRASMETWFYVATIVLLSVVTCVVGWVL